MNAKNKRSIYQRYLTAWSPISDAERLQVLVETMTSGIAYLDALAKCPAKIDWLTHEMAVLKRWKFRRSCEQFAADQVSLLNETIDADIAAIGQEVKGLAPLEKAAELMNCCLMAGCR